MALQPNDLYQFDYNFNLVFNNSLNLVRQKWLKKILNYCHFYYYCNDEYQKGNLQESTSSSSSSISSTFGTLGHFFTSVIFKQIFDQLQEFLKDLTYDFYRYAVILNRSTDNQTRIKNAILSRQAPNPYIYKSLMNRIDKLDKRIGSYLEINSNDMNQFMLLFKQIKNINSDIELELLPLHMKDDKNAVLIGSIQYIRDIKFKLSYYDFLKIIYSYIFLFNYMNEKKLKDSHKSSYFEILTIIGVYFSKNMFYRNHDVFQIDNLKKYIKFNERILNIAIELKLNENDKALFDLIVHQKDVTNERRNSYILQYQTFLSASRSSDMYAYLPIYNNLKDKYLSQICVLLERFESYSDSLVYLSEDTEYLFRMLQYFIFNLYVYDPTLTQNYTLMIQSADLIISKSIAALNNLDNEINEKKLLSESIKSKFYNLENAPLTIKQYEQIMLTKKQEYLEFEQKHAEYLSQFQEYQQKIEDPKLLKSIESMEELDLKIGNWVFIVKSEMELYYNQKKIIDDYTKQQNAQLFETLIDVLDTDQTTIPLVSSSASSSSTSSSNSLLFQNQSFNVPFDDSFEEYPDVHDSSGDFDEFQKKRRLSGKFKHHQMQDFFSYMYDSPRQYDSKFIKRFREIFLLSPMSSYYDQTPESNNEYNDNIVVYNSFKKMDDQIQENNNRSLDIYTDMSPEEDQYMPSLKRGFRITPNYLAHLLSAQNAGEFFLNNLKNLIIIDARNDYEYIKGHIFGAYNLPAYGFFDGHEQYDQNFIRNFFWDVNNDNQPKFGPDVAIVVHCEFSHRRALVIYKYILDHDNKENPHYRNVYILEGGFHHFWKKFHQTRLNDYFESDRKDKIKYEREINEFDKHNFLEDRFGRWKKQQQPKKESILTRKPVQDRSSLRSSRLLFSGSVESSPAGSSSSPFTSSSSSSSSPITPISFEIDETVSFDEFVFLSDDDGDEEGYRSNYKSTPKKQRSKSKKQT